MSTRAANVAKHGDNCAKEARSLEIVSKAIAEHGQLCYEKCAEGARADFCVHQRGDPDRALGVQVKTTAEVQLSTGPRLLRWNRTSGYDERKSGTLGLYPHRETRRHGKGDWASAYHVDLSDSGLGVAKWRSLSGQ